jgi:hypothetical protein
MKTDPMSEALDISIVDAGDKAVVLARRGADVAIGRLPIDDEAMAAFEDFRRRLERAVRGAEAAPSDKDLASCGERLFRYAVRDELADLYRLLPASYSRIYLLSDQPRILRLPWEYLSFPQCAPGHPANERSVVRIVPTRGREAPAPKRLGETIHVLFVSAAPQDQNEVDFAAVRAAIERAYAPDADLAARLKITAVDGATRAAFRREIESRSFDILHFSGHGRVDAQGRGCLLLVNRKNGKTDEVPASDLTALLAGHDLRLVVLSACDTAAGDFADDFAVLAEALVRSGIPAVVANQLPVSNRAMACFVGPLYQELLHSGDIDLAVAKGRTALDFELQSFEWGIPTLYRHYAGGHLYEP